MPYPQELYYTETSSEADYSYTSQGVLEVPRLINGKPYWKKDLSSVTKTKSLILADWTALEWSEEKIEAVIAKISKMMSDGFVFYIQDGERIKPLKKEALSSVREMRVRQGMSIPMMPEALLATTVKQYPKLSPDKVHVLDDYKLDGLLVDTPTLQRERGWPISSLKRLASKKELMSDLIKVVKPPVTHMIYKQFPVSDDEKEIKLDEYFPYMNYSHRYESINLDPEQTKQLLQEGRLFIDGFTLELSHLEHVEELILSSDIPSQLPQILRLLPKLKSIFITNCPESSDLDLPSLRLPSLKKISFEYSILKNATVQKIINLAPSLTHLIMKVLVLDTEDRLHIPSIESISLSDPERFFPNAVLDDIFKTAKKLKTFHYEGDGSGNPAKKRHFELCPDLTEFSISNAILTDKQFTKILHGPIKSINLKKCKGLIYFDGRDLPKLLQLESIRISETEISPRGLKDLLAHAPNLKECFLSTIPDEINISEGDFSYLETLTLDDIKLPGLENLYSAINAMHKLRSLNLDNIKCIETDVPSLSLTNLQELYLRGSITSRLFDFLADAPALEELNICRFDTSTAHAVEHINVPALRKLRITDSNSISATVLKKILAGSKNLVEIDLNDTVVLEILALPALSLPMLKTLGLKSPNLPNMQALLNAATNLEVITFSNILPWNLHGIPSFNVQSLKQLTLSFSALLSKETMHMFLDKAQNLHELDLTISIISDKWGDEEYYLPSLVKLNLSGTIISEKSLLCLLKSARNLKEIVLSDGFISNRTCNWSIETRQALLDSNIKIVGREYLVLSMSTEPQEQFDPLSEEDDYLSTLRGPSAKGRRARGLGRSPLPSEEDEYLSTLQGPSAEWRGEEGLENSPHQEEDKDRAASAGTAPSSSIANLFKKENTVPVDPTHNPQSYKSLKPTQGDFAFGFQGKNPTFNQAMIIEKLSQYLTITDQHKARISELQDGICNALTNHFLTMTPDKWKALTERIKQWNGSHATLTDTLSYDFKALWDSVEKHQFCCSIPKNYLGDNLENFLKNQKKSFVLSNPWHAIAIYYSIADNSWTAYDPNFVGGVKKATTVAELQVLVKQSLGTLVFVDHTFAVNPLINNVNKFLGDGGLLALVQARNKSDMLQQLISFKDYTKEALDGLLLRDTEGTPAWLSAIKTPITAEHTVTLLLNFQQKNSDYLQQLQRSLEALSPQQRHECLVTLTQLKTTFPKNGSLLQELSSKLRPITRHDFRRELETWRKPTAKAPSLDAYCQQLVAKRPNKKQLVTLNSNADTNALSLALLKHCLATSRPVFPINSPDDLVCSASWVERQADGSGIVRKGPGGPLYDFLLKNKGQSPVLVVNYDRFKADDIVRYNTLLDTLRKADGTVLTEDVVVLGLMNPNAPGAYQGADFYSRFDGVESNPVSDQDLHAVVPKNPAEVALNTTTDHYLINLAQSSDWEGKLLGRWLIKTDQLVFEEGELDKALKSNKPICLQNAPWNNLRFQTLWQQALIQKSIIHAGRTIAIPDGAIRSQTNGYDWKNLVSFLRFEKPPSGTKPVIVNPKLMRDLFYTYQCDATKKSLDTLLGLIEQNKKGKLALFTSRSLSEDEWGVVLLACREHLVQLSCQLAPDVTLPAPLALLFPDVVTVQPVAASVWNKSEKRNPLVITSTDVAATVALTTHEEADWVVIDISDCDVNALLNSIDGTFNPDTVRFAFAERIGAVSKALAENKKVLLHGTFSDELMDFLAPLLLKTEISSRLVLVSDSPKTFNYCSTVRHEVTQEEKQTLLKKVCKASEKELDALPKEVSSFNHLRAHLSYNRAFPKGKDRPWQGVYEAVPLALKPFDADNSKKIADAFLKQRLDEVTALLSKGPYVCITGLTGIGKTSFVDNHLAKEPGVVVYYDIKAWMDDKTPGRTKIFVIDEYNLMHQQLTKMDGLFNNHPGILNDDGVYTFLSPEHKLVCMGNPLSTGGERQKSAFIANHGNALAFTPLPPEFIYEFVLKPVFAGTALEAQQLEVVRPILEVYNFIVQQSKVEVLISPRELEMMALMAVSYAQQYPKATPKDHKLAIQHYAYRIGLPLNTNQHRANFEAQFKPKKTLPHERLPQYKSYFLITESRKAVSQQLDDLLALRDFRCSAQATTDAQKYGGLGGIVLDGEAGIGKSELVIAALRARGFEEVHLDSTAPLPVKPFYHMPVSMQLDDKKRLLLKAFDEGALVLIDEINSSPMMEHLLNSLLTGKTPEPEKRRPNKPGFCTIGTENPPTLGGRFIPSNALSRRLITNYVPPYTPVEMQEILVKKKVGRVEAIALVEDYQYNQKKAQREHLKPPPSFRDLLRLAERIAHNSSKESLAEEVDASPDILEEEVDANPEFVEAEIEAKSDPKIKPMGIKKLRDEIKQLRDYGHQLTLKGEKLSVDEGNKAIALADILQQIADQFTQPNITTDKKDEYREQFSKEMEQGYNQMATHRDFWKPLLVNIAIAATVIGLLLIVGKLLTTGSAFFTTTKRQDKVQNIKDSFKTLDNPDEEQKLTTEPSK